MILNKRENEMINSFYLLDTNKDPYPVNYFRWIDNVRNNRKIRHNNIKKYGITISTTFMGYLNEEITYDYTRLNLFETIIYWENNPLFDYRNEKYSSWKEALLGHRKYIREIIKYLRLHYAK